MRQQFDTRKPEHTSGRQGSLPVAELTPATQTKDEQQMTAFLAAMRASLTGLSDAEKQAVLEEMGQHVLASARAFEELGDTPGVALRNAIAAFGAPQTVGNTFAETYQTTGAARRAFPTVALCRALRVCSAAMGLAAGMMLFSVYLHQFTPEWAQSAAGRFYNYHVAWVITLLTPAVAGWFVGRSKVPRAALGTFYALAILALGTAPLMLPSVTNREYAQWQDVLMLVPCFFVFWMLTAPLAAHLSSVAARYGVLLPVRAR